MLGTGERFEQSKVDEMRYTKSARRNTKFIRCMRGIPYESQHPNYDILMTVDCPLHAVHCYQLILINRQINLLLRVAKVDVFDSRQGSVLLVVGIKLCEFVVVG